jgi:S-formylglutathione hydrolase FrmB
VRCLAASLLALLALAPAAAAQDVTFPIVGTETPRGSGTLTALDPVAPTAKTLDGRVDDWTGTGPGFAGTVVRSHGELVYTDHLFDAYGADDGRDAERLEALGPVSEAVPETYRIEALLQNDPAGQFGVDTPPELQYRTNYGDLEREDRADLSEVRVAAGAGETWLLARTTTMASTAESAAVLVLVDTDPAEPAQPRSVPFGSGLTTTRAERAVLLHGDGGRVADLVTGAITDLPTGSVATRADGWDNAIEARLPTDDVRAVAVAAGRPGGEGLANVANVAFRTEEPVREWFDKQQALSLHAGTIDPFFAAVEREDLRAGATERWTPGPGYHERVARSDEALSREQGQEGILQPYGVYLPASYRAGTPAPLQLWLHWRGGTAHSAGASVPGMFRDLGEKPGAIVVSPRGRGTSSWYVGRGHRDVEEVWADVHRVFAIDPARRYVAGHSMGGWGSFLMAITHPDWFAGALPASPPVTQGAWTGADFEGCDELQYDEYSPCYIQANDGDARAQHTRRLLENLRHTPVAIMHGTADELVPVSGVTRQVERLVQLGYRHRYYLFHTQEHFGPPIWDQWGEGAAYLHRFRRPERPARVTHVRDMPFERAIERVNSGGLALDFSFDTNHWLRALEPADATDGQAFVDATSKALPETAPLTVPEAGGPAGPTQAGPYTMTGLRWEANPLATLPKAENALTATLRGARAVRFDTAASGLDTARPLRAEITTEHALELALEGDWGTSPSATVDGAAVPVVVEGGALKLAVPAGSHTVVVQRV